MRTLVVRGLDDYLFKLVSYMFVIFVVILTLYPFVYVLSNSLSDPLAVMRNEVFLWPIGFNLNAYKMILSQESIKIGYYNTLLYTLVGTVINMVFTTLLAYPLSRMYLFGRSFFILMILFTMIFSGGLIPTYLVVKELGMVDTRWALWIPKAVSAWNLILLKSFFERIPKEVEEAAIVDGCTDFQVLRKIILPLSVPALATISLFYAVSHWNDFLTALIYLQDQSLFPIQIFLKNIVIGGQVNEMSSSSVVDVDAELMVQSLKYGTIIIVALPIILVYPFIQKHFVKGITLGALKG